MVTINYKKPEDLEQDINLVEAKIQEGTLEITQSLLTILNLFAESNQENKIKELAAIQKNHWAEYKEYLKVLAQIKQENAHKKKANKWRFIDDRADNEDEDDDEYEEHAGVGSEPFEEHEDEDECEKYTGFRPEPYIAPKGEEAVKEKKRKKYFKKR